MSGKRTFKKLTVNRSEGNTVTKTIRLTEGGAMGEFSVWNRQVAGTAITTVEIYGSFVDNPTEDERFLLNWWSNSTNDYLDSTLWGWYTDFSYLTFVVNFENSEEPPPPPEPEEGEEPLPPAPIIDEPGTVEFYIVSY